MTSVKLKTNLKSNIYVNIFIDICSSSGQLCWHKEMIEHITLKQVRGNNSLNWGSEGMEGGAEGLIGELDNTFYVEYEGKRRLNDVRSPEQQRGWC